METVNACDIHKNTKRIGRKVHPWYNGGITNRGLNESYKKRYSRNPPEEIIIDVGIRLVDSMLEYKKKRWEEVITSTDLTHDIFFQMRTQIT